MVLDNTFLGEKTHTIEIKKEKYSVHRGHYIPTATPEGGALTSAQTNKWSKTKIRYYYHYNNKNTVHGKTIEVLHFCIIMQVHSMNIIYYTKDVVSLLKIK